MFRPRGFSFRKTVVYTVMLCFPIYNCLLEDEPSGSKHVEVISKLKY